MHPNEPQEFEFTLDDIIREFSDPEPEDALAESIAEPEPEPAPEPILPAKSVTTDTVRLEPIAKSPAPQPVSRDTAVFRPISQDTAVFRPVSQDTAVFQPVCQATAVFQPPSMPELVTEPEPPVEVAPPPVQKEPFSDDWEPEYDEPMGEYPQAIPFPPKNRPAVLRKKLVAGPEKRYHTLVSAGLGKLQAGIFLHFLLFLVSAAGTALHAMNILSPAHQRLLVFGQLMLAMVAGCLACYRLLVGLGSLLRGRFSLNTFLFFAFAACLADGYMCLSSQRMPFTTLLCLDLLMAQWAEYQRRNTQMGQMDLLRKALDIVAVVKIPDYYEGCSGYVAMEGDPDSFMDEYHKPSAPETRLDLFGLAAMLISAGLATFVGISRGPAIGLQVLAAGMQAAVPASSLITISRPTAVLATRLTHLGAVLCGWKGVKEADQDAVYPLDHKDLFPGDHAKMNGVKFYGPVDPGRVVAYSSALIAHDGDGMMAVFAHLPRSRYIHRHQVTEFIAYPGGITGLVDGWSVMVGTQEFLTEMGITIPEDARVAQAVYAAVDNQFSAVFALQYSRNKSTAAGMRTLCGYRRVKPVLTSCDFILTDTFIRRHLSVNLRHMVFPEREVRQKLAATPIPEDAPVVALIAKSGLAPKAYAVTGARALRVTLNVGSAVHIAAGAIGLVAVAALMLAGAFDVLNATNLLSYSLVWLVPGFMISEWTRYI